MAIKRPNGARPDRKPRRQLGIRCGFKLPNTYPTGVPYIVTRYLSEQGSKAYKDDEEKEATVVPCRVVGHQENGSTYDFHVEIEAHERHEARRRASLDPDTDGEVMAFAPWVFKIGRRDKKSIEQFKNLKSPVTVLRLPEVEIARSMRDGLPYGINPRSISIRLAMNERALEDREAFFQEKGYYPDFNCFTEHFQVWDNRANAPFCRGNAESYDRRNSETGSIDHHKKGCMPWIKDPETGSPNPHVCQYRGTWNGTEFSKGKNPCAEAIQFAFRVAGVPTLSNYQIFTKSSTAAGNIRPMLNAVLELRPSGNVVRFPMLLSVQWKTFTPTVNGKEFKTEKPVWKLDVDGSVITSLDRRAVTELLDGDAPGAVRSLPAPTELIDMATSGEDHSEFYPDEPDGQTWIEFMFEHPPALELFRELKYTKKKGREVLTAYERKYSEKPRDELTAMFLKRLRAAATKARKAAEPEPESEPPTVEIIDQEGNRVDREGAESLPSEIDFL